MRERSLTLCARKMTYGWRLPVVSMRAQAALLPSSDIVVIKWHNWPERTVLESGTGEAPLCCPYSVERPIVW